MEKTTPHQSIAPSGYRPEIDGLRAIAVIPVVLFHLNKSWLPGGFIGVDVFFVISGFLITQILLGQMTGGTFSFRKFWTKRILRIFPALLAMIVVTLLSSWFVIYRPDLYAVGEQAVAALLSTANIYFWRNAGDYWGGNAENSPLLHTWSLSVEEQFYLALPLALGALVRFAPRSLRTALMVGTACSFCLFLLGTLTGRMGSTFYLLPTRAWELGLGCCLAAAPSIGHPARATVSTFKHSLFGMAGVIMILATYVLVPKLSWGVGCAVIGTGLVLTFARTGLAHTILSQPILVAIGKASYSIYLWHWPAIVLLGVPELQTYSGLLFALILAAGFASYFLIEQPVRHSPALLPAIAGGYILALSLALSTAWSVGTYDTSAFVAPTTSLRYFCVMGPEKLKIALDTSRTMQNFFAGFEVPRRTIPADEYLTGGFITGPPGPPKIVVIGDSHGIMWSPAINSIAKARGLTVSFYGVNGERPFTALPPERKWPPFSFTPQERIAFDAARFEWISRWKPDIVILGCKWIGVEESDAADLLGFLEQNAGQVLLMEDPPELAIGNKNTMQWLCFQNISPQQGVRGYLPAGNVDDYQQGRTFVRKLAQKYRNCTVVPTCDLYEKEADVLVLDGERMVYIDDEHVTDYGAELAASRLGKAIDDRLSSP